MPGWKPLSHSPIKNPAGHAYEIYELMSRDESPEHYDQELEKIRRLAYKSFLGEKLIPENPEKISMLYKEFDGLPNTRTFGLFENNELLETASITTDGPQHLSVDKDFGPVLEFLRPHATPVHTLWHWLKMEMWRLRTGQWKWEYMITTLKTYKAIQTLRSEGKTPQLSAIWRLASLKVEHPEDSSVLISVAHPSATKQFIMATIGLSSEESIAAVYAVKDHHARAYQLGITDARILGGLENLPLAPGAEPVKCVLMLTVFTPHALERPVRVRKSEPFDVLSAILQPIRILVHNDSLVHALAIFSTLYLGTPTIRFTPHALTTAA